MQLYENLEIDLQISSEVEKVNKYKFELKKYKFSI